MRSSGDARPWHLLSAVKGECVPERVLVFQTAPLRSRVGPGVYEDTLLCGHVRCYRLSDGEVTSERAMDFGRGDQLWDFVARCRQKDRATWVYGHSLGYQLTLLDFWRRLDSPGSQLVWAVLSDPPTIVCVRHGKRLVKYVDTVNYFREPLPSLLGGRDGRSSWALDPGASVYDTILWCRKVTHALGDLICRMIGICRRELRSSWQCTAASLSWSVYRHWYLSSPVYMHGQRETLILETDALFGGLLQVSRLGSVPQPTTSFDVNSLYPWVMSTQPLPHKLVRYHDEPNVRQLHDVVPRCYCAAEVDVSTPPYSLPYRRGALAGYSCARGSYVLCGAELADCVRDGMVHACRRLAVYECADLFSRFVRDLYPRKVQAALDGDVAGRWLWKLVLNGLAGKFAQKHKRWTDAKEIIAPKRWGAWWHFDRAGYAPARCRAIAGCAQRLETGGVKRDALPIVTAAIAAAGRSRIREFAALSGPARPFYLDCDSLHLGQQGCDALAAAGVCDDRQLGSLKLVVSGPDAYYWGPKHYRIGSYYVSNIVQLGAVQVADGYWVQQSKRGLEGTLESGVLDRVLVTDQEVRINGTQVTVETAKGHRG